MTVQPKYHWQFTERKGHEAQDSLKNHTARLHKTCSLKGHGRIGRAVHLGAKDSRVVFDDVIGKFGTNDFTVAFGIKILNVNNQNDADLIGNRNVGGHGNWFSLRLEEKGTVLTFEVDETSKGKNFAKAKTKTLSSLPNQKWHHIALVRAGKVLKIFLDGELVAKGISKTGVANINSSVNVKLGHYTRHTPTAQYEDLRIYDSALNEAEIQALIPPINRPLSHGEIELVAADGAAMILRKDVGHLSRFSQEFQRLRVGPDTAVALFNKAGFEGTSQLLYADLPDIKLSRLKDFPASVRIRSAIGAPFTGKWLIKAPNGQFLSVLNFPVLFRRDKKGLNAMLITSPERSLNELFKLQQQSKQSRTQLVHDANKENALFRVAPKTEAIPLFVEEIQPLSGEFAITNQDKNQWLEMGEKNTFQWTNQKEKRAVFARVAKMADKENQVGELAPGEVALYEHVAYHGRTWILSDTEKDLSGEYPKLSAFESLQDKTSSIRLGPKTGVTVFRDSKFRGSADKASLIEDIVENAPNLFDSQIGNDTISSIKILRFIDPTEIFTSYTSKLSQDYRMVGDKLEEFSAYRTTLRLEPDAGEIVVSATDLTQIEVDGENYVIDEQRSVTLKPNAINRIMITSEADGIDTPGLKFRTQSMAPNEQVVIFPNQEVHRQIAELEDGALWNATDTQGNLIVDHKAHSKAEVASVQNTIKRMMGTVAYAENEPTVSTRSVTKRARNSVGAAARAVSSATIEDHPWELNLGKKVTPPNQVIARKSGVAFVQAKSLTSSVATSGIEGKAISQGEFAQLLSQSTSSEKVAPPEPSKGFGAGVAKRGLISSIGRGIKKTVKKAKSVVVGAVKGVVHVLVKTVEGVIDFVVDTVKKVVEFVEAVVETVVKAVKKFIEFLQFLFNWDDILETQRYLKRTVNEGLDTITEQIDSFQQPVSEFIGSLQDSVEERMNSVITLLGGNPSDAETSEPQLPEAAEWFISKLLNGLGQSDASPFPSSSSAQNSDSEIGIFLSTLMESGEDVIGMALRGFEGLTDTIATLIQNPLKPQLALIAIVETFRDIIIQFLDLLETLVSGFLNILKTVIQRFKSLINGKIKIPLISALFKLLGAGDLSILNVTTLLAAIPITIVSKLILGQKPFQEDSLLETATVSELQLASVTAEESPISRQAATSEAKDKAELDKARVDRIRRLGTTQLVLDTISGVFTSILNASAPAETSGKSTGFGKMVISFFEGLTFIIDLLSWGLSYSSFSILAGLNNNQKDAEKEGSENILLLYRLGVLMLDMLFMISSDEKRRMKRQDQATSLFFFLLSVIDLILTSRYLFLASSDVTEIANELVSLLPDLLSPIRFINISGIPGAFALAAVDLLATGLTLRLGIKLNIDTLADLRQASA